MKMLINALTKGFAAEREERLNKWTEIRQDGYWKPWMKRDIPLALLLSVIAAKYYHDPGDTWVDFTIAMVITVVISAPLYLLAEVNIWRSTEKQWKAWRCEKEQNKSW